MATPVTMVRVSAVTQAGRFRAGPLSLSAGTWSAVDASKAKVRRALVDHVGLHCKVHPHDKAKLEAVGLTFDGQRLVVRAAAPPAPPAA